MLVIIITAGCERGGVDDDWERPTERRPGCSGRLSLENKTEWVCDTKDHRSGRQELCIAHGAGPRGKQTHRGAAMLNENKGGRLHCSWWRPQRAAATPWRSAQRKQGRKHSNGFENRVVRIEKAARRLGFWERSAERRCSGRLSGKAGFEFDRAAGLTHRMR